MNRSKHESLRTIFETSEDFADGEVEISLSYEKTGAELH